VYDNYDAVNEITTMAIPTYVNNFKVAMITKQIYIFI